MPEIFRGKCHSCMFSLRYSFVESEELRNRYGEIFSVLHFNEIYRCNISPETKYFDPEKGLINYSGLPVERSFRCPLWRDRRVTKRP